MKIVKGIIKYTIFLILILVLAFNVYNYIARNILKRDLPTIGGYGVLEVISGSMEPTISIGDLIIINTKDNNYKVEDIVTFYDTNGSFVTHRIKEINGSNVVTKGDANNTQDEEFNSNKIVGKYVTKIDNLGILFKSLKSPLVMVLILAIGIVICLLISTDKSLTPIDISDDDKEFLEFKKNKENNKRK